ncbi:DNA-3-methyladenine glycosylase I [Desulfocastanea catecholica]
MKRCDWVTANLLAYHDEEWGVPVHDDRRHFEMLILEGAQAGLSWETVLRKREAYRTAFQGFAAKNVACMTDNELEEQVENPGIIRNRLKIFTTRKNAIVFLDIQKEFGSFDAYIWRFAGGKPLDGKRQTITDVPATTAESWAISKDLKKRACPSLVQPSSMHICRQLAW